MPAVNKVFLMGNLTRDPDLKYVPSGAAVAEFGLAVNQKYKGEDQTVFVEISAWAKTGELCAEYLQKGSLVFIEGSLKFDQWERDGRKQTKLSVVANNVQFVGKKE